jgi:pyridoxine/pyridoxamine 5'-phosphate oxidase
MQSKQGILSFIDSKSLMTLATINNDGNPESAVVGFGQTDEFELIFSTSWLSRKAKNILNNQNVAVIIGWDDQGTVQYEGSARALSGDKIKKYSELYFQKNPKARLYKHDPNQRYFLITPRWLRFTELTTFPWPTTELRF